MTAISVLLVDDDPGPLREQRLRRYPGGVRGESPLSATYLKN